MGEIQRKLDLRQRIRKGDLGRKDVVRRLAELAFGKANDCVRLVCNGNIVVCKFV